MIPMFKRYISEKVGPAVRETLNSIWIGQGHMVDSVWKKFENMFNAKGALTLNSCTSAIHLALVSQGRLVSPHTAYGRRYTKYEASIITKKKSCDAI